MEKNNDDKKFIYDKVYDELNRSRDWPIKVLTFVSALYITLLGFTKINKNEIELCFYLKLFIVTLMLIISIYTIIIIIRQHKNYLKYRNVLIKLQKSMKIYDWQASGENIFPSDWQDHIEERVWEHFGGWLFYALYLIILTIMSSVLLFSI
jgi:hypothetical protein